MTTIPAVSGKVGGTKPDGGSWLPAKGWLTTMVEPLRVSAAQRRTDAILRGLDARMREDIGADIDMRADRPVFLAGFHPRIPPLVLTTR